MHSLTQTVHPHVPLFVTVQVRAHIENERENKKCFGKSLPSVAPVFYLTEIVAATET